MASVPKKTIVEAPRRPPAVCCATTSVVSHAHTMRFTPDTMSRSCWSPVTSGRVTHTKVLPFSSEPATTVQSA